MTGIEAELIGGPADGMLIAVADPAPPMLTVFAGPPVPPAWIEDTVGWSDPVPLRTVEYRRLELWNPRTRRRQYAHG